MSSERAVLSQASLPAGRLWIFRLVAVLVLPLLGLGFLELGLRLAGYGYPVSYLLPRVIGGESKRVENAWFGLRFFPHHLLRSPSPTVIAATKPPGVYRIFLFGESAALGDPRPSYGVGRYLETLLRERFPGAEFEVIPAAMTAINSHALRVMARECARYQGDLWILYMGNNELMGPFGATPVFGETVPSSLTVRAYLALQRFRAGQWLAAWSRKLRPNSTGQASWGGMKMFMDQQVSPASPGKERVYQNFQFNLEDILQVGQASSIPIIVSSVAVNLKDCAPFGSVHSPGLSAPKLTSWQTIYEAGISNLVQGNWNQAVASFQEAIRGDQQYAEAHFRLGQGYMALTNTEAAKLCFVRARDLDTLPFRADSRINQILQATAQRYTSNRVSFLDAEKVLEILNSDQALGQELFYEHAHLNFTGNYCLARALAEKIVSYLSPAILSRQTSQWAEPERCARMLGLTDWNRLTVFEEISRRLADAPFTNQVNHLSRMKRLANDLAEIKRRLQPGRIPEARSIYEEAIKKRPEDFWLHYNYAEFLKGIGDWSQAIVQMKKVRDLTPQNSVASLQLGRLFARQAQFDEARQAFSEALRLRPDLGEVYLELGQAMAAGGKWDEALAAYASAQERRPDDAVIPLRRAEVFLKQKKRAEALFALREAIRLRPSQWEAHYFLGMELAGEEKNKEAEAEFEVALQLQPDHILSRLNLGIVLARQARFEEALACFRETLRLDPHNAKAQEFIDHINQLRTGR